MNKPVKEYTIAFVIREGKILLGLKKRGLLRGKWNGFGGKVEKGETIEAAACRELEEECGLIASPSGVEKIGVLNVEWSSCLNKIYLFTVAEYTGKVVESEEMLPKWFPLESIPYDEMCKDNEYWYPLMLDCKKFDAYFVYGENTDGNNNDNNGVILKYCIDVEENEA